MAGGARLETDNLSAISGAVVAIDTSWVFSVTEKRSGSSWSRPMLEWTKWQEIQSKSTCDESRSWSCKGLPNKAIAQKQSINTMTVHFDLTEPNLPEFKPVI